MSLSIPNTHTHSLGRMSEREEARIRDRDYCCREIIFIFLGFTFSSDSISEEVAGFSPLWFPRGKLFVSLVFIFVHVILSVKDPRIIMLA